MLFNFFEQFGEGGDKQERSVNRTRANPEAFVRWFSMAKPEQSHSHLTVTAARAPTNGLTVKYPQDRLEEVILIF